MLVRTELSCNGVLVSDDAMFQLLMFVLVIEAACEAKNIGSLSVFR